MFFNKIKAVSYVEIVLVLVIVGVISSLAIPSLKRYSQKEELGRLAQKSYLTLNDAIDNSIMENGPTYKWKKPQDGNSFGKYIAPYLKQSSTTGTGNAVTSVITKDGMKISFDSNLKEMNDTSTGYLATIFINIDINGDKGPNVTGKDRHEFSIDCIRSKLNPSNPYTKELFANNWKFTEEMWNRNPNQKPNLDANFDLDFELK